MRPRDKLENPSNRTRRPEGFIGFGLITGLFYEALESSVVSQSFEFEVFGSVALQARILGDSVAQVSHGGRILVGAGSYNSFEVAGDGIRILHFVKRVLGSVVVLVQDLCQSSTVGLGSAQVLSSLCVVTFGGVEVTEGFVVTVGVAGFRQQLHHR